MLGEIQDWTTNTVTTPNIGGPVTIEPNGSYSTRYFKYEGRAKWNQYVGILEFEVYEWLGGGPTPPSLGGLSNLALNKTAVNGPAPYGSMANHGLSLLTDGNNSTYWQGNYVFDNCTSIYNASLCPMNRWFTPYSSATIDLGFAQTAQAIRLTFPAGVQGTQSLYALVHDSSE